MWQQTFCKAPSGLPPHPLHAQQCTFTNSPFRKRIYQPRVAFCALIQKAKPQERAFLSTRFIPSYFNTRDGSPRQQSPMAPATLCHPTRSSRKAGAAITASAGLSQTRLRKQSACLATPTEPAEIRPASAVFEHEVHKAAKQFR